MTLIKPARQVTAAPGAPFWKTALEADVLQLAFDPSRRAHAVIDGAFFDDLPKLLDDHQLAARPLFGGGTPQALVNAGPWLVDLYHLPFEEPEEPAPDADAAGEPDLSDAALAARAEAMAEDMRKAVEAGDDTGGLAPPQDENAYRFGPLADPAIQVRALMDLSGDKPALVFWIGAADLTHERLFRHLRSINKILVPKEDGEPEGSDAAGQPDTAAQTGSQELQAVLFRHADGNVLASVLPVLNETQFTRLFGPALALTFHAPDHPDEQGWPIRRAVLPFPAAPAPPGMLVLNAEQMRGVEAARLERSRRKVMNYLRVVDPEAAEGLSDLELQTLIIDYEQIGDAYGLRSERAHMKWAYLMSVSKGEIGNHAETRQFFLKSSKHPDDRIDDLLDMFDDFWTKTEYTS